MGGWVRFQCGFGGAPTAGRHGDAGDADGHRAAALAWAFAEGSAGQAQRLGHRFRRGRGLVAITPASGFVGPTPAVIIGIVAGSFASLQQPL